MVCFWTFLTFFCYRIQLRFSWKISKRQFDRRCFLTRGGAKMDIFMYAQVLNLFNVSEVRIIRKKARQSRIHTLGNKSATYDCIQLRLKKYSNRLKGFSSKWSFLLKPNNKDLQIDCTWRVWDTDAYHLTLLFFLSWGKKLSWFPVNIVYLELPVWDWVISIFTTLEFIINAFWKCLIWVFFCRAARWF